MSDTIAARGDPAGFDYQSREWIEHTIKEWLLAPDSSPVCVVTGPPGTGKSRVLHATARAVELGRLPAKLIAAVVRDRNGGRHDPHNWTTVAEGLRSAAASAPASASALQPYVGSISNVGEVSIFRTENLVVNSYSPTSDLRENLIPALRKLGPGPPLLIVFDALDELFRDQADDLLEPLQLLVNEVASARSDGCGIARLRILLSSQPQLPLELSGFVRPVVVDLARPPADDADALRRHLLLILGSQDDDTLLTEASRLASAAKGVWSWAVFVARALAEQKDASAGRPFFERYLPPDGTWYDDATRRLRRRVSAPDWLLTRKALGMVAASQMVDDELPTELARIALGLKPSAIRRLLSLWGALISETSSRSLVFFHPDFGRWLIATNDFDVEIGEAHEAILSCLTSTELLDPVIYSYSSRVRPHHVVTLAEHASRYGHGLSLAREALKTLADPMIAERGGQQDWFRNAWRLVPLLPNGQRFPGTDHRLEHFLRTSIEVARDCIGSEIRLMVRSARARERPALSHDSSEHASAVPSDDHLATSYGRIVAESTYELVAAVARGLDVAATWHQVEAIRRDLLSVSQGESSHDAFTAVLPRLKQVALAWKEVRTNRLNPANALYLEYIAAVRWLIEDGEATEEGELRLISGFDTLESLAAAAPVLSELRIARGDLCALVAAVVGGESESRWLEAAVESYEREEATSSDETFVPRWRLRALRQLEKRLGWTLDPSDQRLSTPAGIEAAVDGSQFLGECLQWRWRRTQDVSVLTEAIAAYRTAVELTPPEDHGGPAHISRLISLGNSLLYLLRGSEDVDADLVDVAIATQGELTHVFPVERRPAAFQFLGECLQWRWRRTQDVSVLTEAIAAYRTAVELTPPEDHGGPAHISRLISLGNSLLYLLRGSEDVDADLVDVAIATQGELTHVFPVERRPAPFQFLGECLEWRWRRTQDVSVLTEAIAAYRTAVELTLPEDHGGPAHISRLISLGDALLYLLRGSEDVDADLVDVAIATQGELTHVFPVERRPAAFQFLGECLEWRWRRTQDVSVLTEAIAAYRTAVELTPPEDHGGPAHISRLISLGDALLYLLRGSEDVDADLVDVAIATQGELTHVFPVERRPAAFQFLGECLEWRWRRTDHVSVLTEAIVAYRTAVELTLPEDHGGPAHISRLISLANAFWLAYVESGDSTQLGSGRKVASAVPSTAIERAGLVSALREHEADHATYG